MDWKSFVRKKIKIIEDCAQSFGAINMMNDIEFGT